METCAPFLGNFFFVLKWFFVLAPPPNWEGDGHFFKNWGVGGMWFLGLRFLL